MHGGTWTLRNTASMSNAPDDHLDGEERSRFIIIRIHRRSCLEWAGWFAWLVLVSFFLQNAIASGQEGESRAATLFWILIGVLLIAGAIVYVVRKVEIDNEYDKQGR